MQGREIRTCAQKTRFLFFLFTRRSFVGFRSVFVVLFPALLRLGVDGVNIFQESASRIGLSNLQAKYCQVFTSRQSYARSGRK